MEFETDGAIIAYVTDELQQAMPEGWAVRRQQRLRPGGGGSSVEGGLGATEWYIARSEERFPYEHYLVWVSEDRRTFIFIHSNDDGAKDSLLPLVLRTASLVDCYWLNVFPLRDIAARVMASYPPNVPDLS